MNKRPFTASFTGHREIRTEDRRRLKTALPAVIESLFQRGIKYYGCGGAWGFDLMAADAVLEVKRQHPEIQLVMVLPCKDQIAKWRDRTEIKHYKRLVDNAYYVKYTAEEYSRDCYAIRNQHLVNCASVLIAYCYKSNSGAAQTVNMARKAGIEIINLV